MAAITIMQNGERCTIRLPPQFISLKIYGQMMATVTKGMLVEVKVRLPKPKSSVTTVKHDGGSIMFSWYCFAASGSCTPQSEGRSHFGCPCRQIQVLVEPEGANFGAHTSLGWHQERTLNILINFLLFEHDCLGILPDLGKVMIHPNNL